MRRTAVYRFDRTAERLRGAPGSQIDRRDRGDAQCQTNDCQNQLRGVPQQVPR
jgi:hypothetical protein